MFRNHSQNRSQNFGNIPKIFPTSAGAPGGGRRAAHLGAQKDALFLGAQLLGAQILGALFWRSMLAARFWPLDLADWRQKISARFFGAKKSARK